MKYVFVSLCVIFSIFAQAQVQQMDLLSTWSDSTLPGSDQYNNTYNEVWGFAINDHEYAVIGSTMGTHIFDVTDPVNIVLREFIPGASQGGHIIHRDYHDYNGYLYAVSDESGGGTKSTLQIIDISGLPDNISVAYDDDDLIERSHNIFIDTLAAKMYALSAKGGDSAFKAMKIYSLADPLNPVKIGQYGVIGGESFGHVHDAYVENDTAFMNCGNDGLFIVDFAGDDPILIDRFKNSDYPEAGYNHSGWLTEDKEYYYFADETWGTAMKVMKVNDFQGMEIAGTFDAGNDNQYSIAHNQLVHNGFLYVSYYYDGLQVYDIADPANPVRKYEYATSTIEHRNNYEGSWGVYPFLPSGNIIVSDMQEGLFMLKGPSSVSVEELALDESIQVFPNPSTGMVKVTSANKLDRVELYTVHGQLIQTQDNLQNGTFEFNENAVDGLYFLRVYTDAGFLNSRIFLQK